MLCSPTLGESDTYPAVSCGGGGAENRNVPNDTAAPLDFVENLEAARYVFVVVVVGDVMNLAVVTSRNKQETPEFFCHSLCGSI